MISLQKSLQNIVILQESKCQNKQDGIHSQGPTPPPPPQRFLYLRETKSWRLEGRGREGENVHLLTHTTARGLGKNINLCTR